VGAFHDLLLVFNYPGLGRQGRFWGQRPVFKDLLGSFVQKRFFGTFFDRSVELATRLNSILGLILANCGTRCWRSSGCRGVNGLLSREFTCSRLVTTQRRRPRAERGWSRVSLDSQFAVVDHLFGIEFRLDRHLLYFECEDDIPVARGQGQRIF
jgi:hypothetical protein